MVHIAQARQLQPSVLHGLQLGQRQVPGVSAGRAEGDHSEGVDRRSVLTDKRMDEDRKQRKLCPHQRQRHQCKECGGSAFCEHQRIRSQCKDCGGGSICEHQRRRSECKDCGGGAICEHQRIRSRCKDCGGSAICEHQRRRSECKDCGGSAICEHQRRRRI